MLALIGGFVLATLIVLGALWIAEKISTRSKGDNQ